MEKTKIDWADYTWNAVVGCKYNCFYCYANKQCKRWGNDFTPHWSYDQETKPYKIKEPSKIFVCSFGELFGEWISNEWIEKVLQIVKDNPRHTFQFLTKNPKRYLEFEFPGNCWLGTTIDYPNQERINWLKKKSNYKFISFEPLLGDMSGLDLSGIDFAIVGAMTGPGAIIPENKWIKSIKHPNMFHKENIVKYLPSGWNKSQPAKNILNINK
ncbi:MAG: DUF5131 family protein [Candidatus Staskawiczbacteria bacterium]|nr:DUF5131 family protein [Candidatus Staskawiczbacteria bacterium]